jgi:hypothetical protein
MSSITTPNLLPDAVAADKRRYFMKSIAAPDGEFRRGRIATSGR